MTKHRSRPRGSLPGGESGAPIVALVGRPNVGKSTLFNRLARARLAIVHDSPGVTRDRHYADTSAFGRQYTLLDTGGFDPEDSDPMRVGIARHVRAAIDEAAVIVFITDAPAGPNDADRAAVGLLRASGKPVLFAANKADSPDVDAEAFELYRLGVDRVFPISALHGRGIGDLESAIVRALPDDASQDRDNQVAPARIAIIGRPNAGKSSLLNRILGQDRMLVDSRPGTTRDAVDTLFQRDGRPYVFVDTAGLRRKAKVAKEGDEVESLSVGSAIRTIDRSHIVVLLCDGAEGVAEQDAKILGLAEERGRAMIVALNKIDLLSKRDLAKAEATAREKLAFAPYVPIVGTSAKTGRGVDDLIATVDRVRAAFSLRVSTGELNRFFEQVLAQRPPPTSGGRAPRLFYVTQAEVEPPTFVAMTSSPEAIHFSYRRFIVNRLREHFGFEGVPVVVRYRARRRRAAKQVRE
ncbi:MAG: ribosome biogenesis GTPase Der [Polyangiaceae bacterium]